MKFHKLNIAVFVITITVITVFLFTAPRTKSEDVKDTERRNLAEFPAFSLDMLRSGEYTKQIAVYFSDTVPFREKLTSAASRFNGVMGVNLNKVTIYNYGGSRADNQDQGQDNANTQPPVTTPPPPMLIDNSETTAETVPETTAWDGVIGEQEQTDIEAVADITNNGIIIYDTTALMIYGGYKPAGTRYANVLGAYRDSLPNSVNIYNLVNPTSVEFLCPADYRRLNGSQRDNINHIYQSLKAGITPVNAYSALAAHTDENIFLRTDHHWAPLGAYYAAEEFCKTAGVEFADLSEYEQVVIPGYVGTMYGYTNDSRLKNNPEDFVYYKPLNTDYSVTYYNFSDPSVPIESGLFFKQPVGSSYCVFLGGDEKITRIKTSVGNGRKLAVFKDSFGNALIPFLTGSFDEIIVIDIRYFPYKAVDYLTQNDITDVLFANNIFAANTDSLINYIEKIM